MPDYRWARFERKT